MHRRRAECVAKLPIRRGVLGGIATVQMMLPNCVGLKINIFLPPDWCSLCLTFYHPRNLDSFGGSRVKTDTAMLQSVTPATIAAKWRLRGNASPWRHAHTRKIML